MIYLVRHGEVHNPDHVVYADLDGFALSERGRAQAVAAAEYLAGESDGNPHPVGVVTSPLQRARETAAIIADRLDASISVDERLTEWALARGWAGLAWDDLPRLRPGELEAYLDHPADLPFAAESLHDVAGRVVAAIREAADRLGTAVVVSHQDPIQAARLQMTGRPATTLHHNKPGHAAVICIDSAACCELDAWEPDQAEPFPPVAR